MQRGFCGKSRIGPEKSAVSKDPAVRARFRKSKAEPTFCSVCGFNERRGDYALIEILRAPKRRPD